MDWNSARALAGCLALVSGVAWAQAQPWFIQERPGRELALQPDETGPALRACLAKPGYFVSLDAMGPNLLSSLTGTSQARQLVREAAGDCYVAASVPGRLRVPQPPVAAVAGEWGGSEALECGGARLRLRLAVQLPAQAVDRGGPTRLRPDRGYVNATVSLHDAQTNARLATVQMAGYLGDSLDSARLVQTLGYRTATDPRGLLAQAPRLSLEVDGSDRGLMSVGFEGARCQATATLRRVSPAPPAQSLACADRLYREAIADRDGAAARCRHFEASAVSCGMRKALELRNLPQDSQAALIEALDAELARARSALPGAGREVAETCLQSLFTTARFYTASAATEAVLGFLQDGTTAYLEATAGDAETGSQRLRGLLQQLGERLGKTAELVMCPGAALAVVERGSELLAALHDRRNIPPANAALLRYLEWAQLPAEQVLAQVREGAGRQASLYRECQAGLSPDDALLRRAIDEAFVQWSQRWIMDRYSAGSVQITRHECSGPFCGVSGVFTFVRSGRALSIPFTASVAGRTAQDIAVRRLCYDDTTTGMQDCTPP